MKKKVLCTALAVTMLNLFSIEFVSIKLLLYVF